MKSDLFQMKRKHKCVKTHKVRESEEEGKRDQELRLMLLSNIIDRGRVPLLRNPLIAIATSMCNEDDEGERCGCSPCRWGGGRLLLVPACVSLHRVRFAPKLRLSSELEERLLDEFLRKRMRHNERERRRKGRKFMKEIQKERNGE